LWQTDFKTIGNFKRPGTTKSIFERKKEQNAESIKYKCGPDSKSYHKQKLFLNEQ
jgi:hypothetical protein